MSAARYASEPTPAESAKTGRRVRTTNCGRRQRRLPADGPLFRVAVPYSAQRWKEERCVNPRTLIVTPTDRARNRSCPASGSAGIVALGRCSAMFGGKSCHRADRPPLRAMDSLSVTTQSVPGFQRKGRPMPLSASGPVGRHRAHGADGAGADFELRSLIAINKIFAAADRRHDHRQS
jgi:hypothetical protein